ncbi:hypothetical protein ElyMa_003738000 [Elysia marginata]|uniref:Uncharacterized protein n=1 Tax=Elysia marginata TaxID=1093978 RepID=A0AAV4F783_9GAST|nr:hypothetical protein ElyMa_003738000 [Elysia marginata]
MSQLFKQPLAKGEYVTSRNIKAIDKELFSKDRLSSPHPETITTISDLERVILGILNNHAPQEHQRCKQIKRAKKEKRRAEGRWKKSGLTIDKEL